MEGGSFAKLKRKKRPQCLNIYTDTDTLQSPIAWLCLLIHSSSYRFWLASVFLCLGTPFLHSGLAMALLMDSRLMGQFSSKTWLMLQRKANVDRHTLKASYANHEQLKFLKCNMHRQSIWIIGYHGQCWIGLLRSSYMVLLYFPFLSIHWCPMEKEWPSNTLQETRIGHIPSLLAPRQLSGQIIRVLTAPRPQRVPILPAAPDYSDVKFVQAAKCRQTPPRTLAQCTLLPALQVQGKLSQDASPFIIRTHWLDFPSSSSP